MLKETRERERVRVAFITNMAPHYRKPLFEELHRRTTVDFFFFSMGQERYKSAKMEHTTGAYHEIPLRRIRVGHQTITPGLGRYLRPERYDVIVKCMNGRLMVPFVAGLARTRRMPLILWTGAWDRPQTVFRKATNPVANEILRRGDAVVVYGEHVRNYLRTVPGMDGAKIFVAGQAVDNERFARSLKHETPEARPEVLFVGQLEERKGVDYLVDAFLSLPHKNARLILAGTGSLESHFAERTSLDPRIEMVGHVAQERLPTLLSRARCLVLPSVTTKLYGREPWGLVVNEAMHSGVPVIASDAVGAAAGGLVKDGRNGMVVPERDGASLARAIARMLDDPSLARNMGDRAAEDVERFTFSRMADAFECAWTYAMTHAQAKRMARA